MDMVRSSGVLLHVTSLPGPDGIGDLGPEALQWVERLAVTGCHYWQILPLGPTGYGDSPYQCFSAFAGNPYLVASQPLLDEGLLVPSDVGDRPQFSPHHVDYGRVIPWKLDLLDRAFDRFPGDDEYLAFRRSEAAWLDDFALFMALKDQYGGRPWVDWPAPLRDRHPSQIERVLDAYREEVERHAFRQWLFHRQWEAVRGRAHERGLRVIGDIPIFVAHDSADVWANRELFFLDDEGRPTVVAGVPPDYFSPTGQLWGNPLYDWDRHRHNGYEWWLGRLRSVLSQVDVVRLDHFRGFAGYWEIPADAETAIAGRWVPGPGADFLQHVQAVMGDLPIIAEDLGEITPDVHELRDRFELPGMAILQFAFDSDLTNPFLPLNLRPRTIVYTGTHDNDTSWGWWGTAPEHERRLALDYLEVDGTDIAWDLIRAGWRSPAAVSVAPLQDILDLATEARMNFPSRPAGNWRWRVGEPAIADPLVERLASLNAETGRLVAADQRSAQI
jgi:4-alpha-glucanotransferase